MDDPTPITDHTDFATWLGGVVAASLSGAVAWLFRVLRGHDLKLAVLEERLAGAVSASTTYHQVVMDRLDRIENKIDTLTTHKDPHE